MLKNKFKLSNNCILLIASLVSFAFLLLYLIRFIGTGFSQYTSDWGAFGNYAGACVGILSIALIYITYREQRRTNEITRTEQHISTMTKTLNSISEKNSIKLKNHYSKLCKHFNEQISDLQECEYDKVIRVCKYYYSSLTTDYQDSMDLNCIFHYMRLCVDFILQDKTLTKDYKQLRITELACILPEAIRILFLFWSLIYNNDKLNQYYAYGLFSLDDRSSNVLSNIVTCVCTKRMPLKKKKHIVNLNGIIMDDRQDEQFYATYERLNSK